MEPQGCAMTPEEKKAMRKARKEAKLAEKKKRAAAAKAKAKEGATVNAKGLGKKKLRLKKEFINPTPKGEKKDVSKMPDEYDPPKVEAAWYDWWEKQGYFKADATDESRPTYTIVVPPPNVTGYLHMGHALTGAVEDVLIRWHRMKGHNTLWVPGCDHAGIATQVVVEKRLMARENKTRHDLGRKKFLEECWNWKEDHGNRIYEQMRRLGSSLDWTRESFTMSDSLSEAVTEAFVRLHERGLIYRKTRLVNWDCHLKTAVSNIEVDNIELDKPTYREVLGHPKGNKYKFGVLVDFAYPIEDSDEKLVISTTRPETMLGDTGIAVHPDDERYKHLHGKFAIHPFNGRRIPIVCDSELVDMTFGTGVVKITPAHDENDYKCGERHSLPLVNIMTDEGIINKNGAPFEGMPRFEARIALIKALKEKGLYVGERPNKMTIPVCSRSKDVIEPLLKPQWWVDVTGMAARAVSAVEKGDLEIIPENPNVKTWYSYLRNVRPWCISRQLWWGHRVPAYLVTVEGLPEPDAEENDNYVVARNEEEAMEKAKKKYPEVDASKITLKQDPDVLDTWFSSALFPFSTLGWPNEDHPDFKRFYPTQVLETGHDILFFWVARMVMMALELTDQLPFTKVFLHPMVRDAHGIKMSKSLGNVIDPIDVTEGIRLEDMHEKLKNGNLEPEKIEKGIEGQKKDFPNGISECGTDAMRFALCAYTAQGRSINFNINVVISYRNFCNKMLNATKFALCNMGKDFVPMAKHQLTEASSPVERWLLAKLAGSIKTVNDAIDNFHLSNAALASHNLWLHRLCDVYMEAIKPYCEKGADEARRISALNTLYTVIETNLRLLHPFMPYITEELWQRLPKRPGNECPSVMIAKYPEEEEAPFADETAEKQGDAILGAVHAIRSFRSASGLKPKARPPVVLKISNDEECTYFANWADTIATLAQCSEVAILNKGGTPPEGWAVSVDSESLEIYMNLKGMVDVKKGVAKLDKQKKRVAKDLESLKKKMASKNYAKVPDHVKQKNNERCTALENELIALDEAIEHMKALE